MKKHFNLRSLSYVCLCLVLAGCSDSDCLDGMCGDTDDYGVTRAPLNAQCSVVVSGYGSVDMETDYVPNVTCCENGGAPDQALRAQAVGARTFAYYKLSIGAGTAGNPIKNSQGDQVYKCDGRADSRLPACKAATNDTSGVVLQYGNSMLCSFYVSGSKGSCLNSECKDTGNTGASCYASQQKYVTYNEGKSGSNVTQSTLGWVSASNKANRGCMSQNGATCLDKNRGYNWVKIVKFFYGADVQIVKAAGSCVNSSTTIPGENDSGTVATCETVLSKSGTIIDDKDACFTRTAVESWYEQSKGHGGHLYYTYGWANAAEAIGKWTVNVTRPGKYEVFAYVTDLSTGNDTMSNSAPFTIRASGVEKKVSLNMAGKKGWVSLGAYDFAKGGDQWVKLNDATGEKYDSNARKIIVFDAIKFEDAITCTNQCSKNGSLECSGNGWRKCADTNGDGCLEWSAVTACGASQTCVNGACQDVQQPDPCTDDCAKTGDTACLNDGAYHVCGTYDDDACLDWSDAVPCNPDETCVDGACVANPDLSCEHECSDTERMCDGEQTVLECGQFDDDACREWSDSLPCPTGEVCRFGECQPVADSSGTKGCVLEIDGRASTIIDELDPCFERSIASWPQLQSFGYDNHLFYAPVNTSDVDHLVGTYHLNVTKPGKYTIKAYIEAGIGNVVSDARYTVYASGKTHQVDVKMSDDESKGAWVVIGDFDLAVGNDQYVRLSDDAIVPDKDNTARRFVFDAIEISPYDPNADHDDDDDGSYGADVTVRATDDCSASPLSRRSPLLPLGFVFVASALGFAYRKRICAKIQNAEK